MIRKHEYLDTSLPRLLEETLEDIKLLSGEGGSLPPLLLPTQRSPVRH